MPHQLNSLTANLVVSDVARSLPFYRDVLGFSVTATVPPDGGELVFTWVTGIRDAWASLEKRVKVVMPLEVKWYGMTEFAFEDPDGYTITFAEREPEA